MAMLLLRWNHALFSLAISGATRRMQSVSLRRCPFRTAFSETSAFSVRESWRFFSLMKPSAMSEKHAAAKLRSLTNI